MQTQLPLGRATSTALVLAIVASLILALSLRAQESAAPQATPIEPSAFAGEWIYFDYRTEGTAPEHQRPNLGGRFTVRVEADALVVVQGSATRPYVLRIPSDGSKSELVSGAMTTRTSGRWENGVLEYESHMERDGRATGLVRTRLELGAEGLLVRVNFEKPVVSNSTCLYKHPDDIALPEPAKAKVGDVAWIAGAWTGTMGASSIEERWSPPAGGAMLATARTVSRERMVAFEFLRIVERNGGLVYVAQPNGVPPTDFALTSLTETRAVFENPRHDFPQRIVYERVGDNGLTASISHCRGGQPQLFEFKREAR